MNQTTGFVFSGSEILVEHAPKVDIHGQPCTGANVARVWLDIAGDRIPVATPGENLLEILEMGDQVHMTVDDNPVLAVAELKKAGIACEELPPVGANYIVPLKNVLVTCAGCGTILELARQL